MTTLPFPGEDPIAPNEDTKLAIEILLVVLDSGGTPDQALGFLASKNLILDQANAFKLLVGVQRFREKRAKADKLIQDALKDMPVEIDLSLLKELSKA